MSELSDVHELRHVVAIFRGDWLTFDYKLIAQLFRFAKFVFIRVVQQ